MKIDMHVHTKHSYDGSSKVREIFEAADKRGLDGVAITDHFNNRAWEEAKEVSEEMDMHFIPGEEVRILDDEKRTRAEVLVYFLDKPLGNKTMEGIEEEVRSQDGLIFIAHPYAKARPSPSDIDSLLKYVDGIETLNSRARLNKTNRKAMKFAEGKNLPVVGGSDAHIPLEIGYSYTEVKDAENLEEFKKGLREGRSIVKGKITNFFLHYLSQVKGRL